MSRALKAQILLVLITLLWGATFVFIKGVLSQITPLAFNAVRMIVAGLALVLIYRHRLRDISRQAILAGSYVGVALWLGYSFQTTGLYYTTPSKSAFITSLYVVLTPVLLAIISRRMPRPWTALGVIAAVFGLYLMTVPAGTSLSLTTLNHGDIISFVCAIAFAFHIILISRALRRFAFEDISVIQTVSCALFMVITVPLENAHASWTWEVIAVILFTAIFCSALAYTVQTWAQQFTPPTHAALIFSLEPVFAVLTSAIVLHEHLGLRSTCGAILILGGILISELKGAAAPKREVREAGAA